MKTTTTFRFDPKNDKEMIEHLKSELKRVKMQRNDYEQKLLLANRNLNRVETELKLLESYINRTSKQEG